MRIPYEDWERFKAVLSQSTCVSDLLDVADERTFELLFLLLDRPQPAAVAEDMERFMSSNHHPFHVLALALEPMEPTWGETTARRCFRARKLARTQRLQLFFRQEICNGGDQYARHLVHAFHLFRSLLSQEALAGSSPTPHCFEQLCLAFSLLLDISPDLSQHDELFHAVLPMATHPCVLRELKVGLDRCGVEDDALRTRGIAAFARDCIVSALLTHLCSDDLAVVQLSAGFLADLVKQTGVDMPIVMISDGPQLTALLVSAVQQFVGYLKHCGPAAALPFPLSSSPPPAVAVAPPAGLTRHDINKVLHTLLLLLRSTLDCLDSRAPDGFLFGCRFFRHDQVTTALKPQLLSDLFSCLLDLIPALPSPSAVQAADSGTSPDKATATGQRGSGLLPASAADTVCGTSPNFSPSTTQAVMGASVASPGGAAVPITPSADTPVSPLTAEPSPPPPPQASITAHTSSPVHTVDSSNGNHQQQQQLEPVQPQTGSLSSPLVPPPLISCQILIDLLHIVSSLCTCGIKDIHEVLSDQAAYPQLLAALPLYPLCDPLHVTAANALISLCQNGPSSLLHVVFQKQGLLSVLANLPDQVQLRTSGRMIRPSYIPSLGRVVMCLEACTDQCVSSTADPAGDGDDDMMGHQAAHQLADDGEHPGSGSHCQRGGSDGAGGAGSGGDDGGGGDGGGGDDEPMTPTRPGAAPPADLAIQLNTPATMTGPIAAAAADRQMVTVGESPLVGDAGAAAESNGGVHQATPALAAHGGRPRYTTLDMEDVSGDPVQRYMAQDTWAAPGHASVGAEGGAEGEEPVAWVLWQALQQSGAAWGRLLAVTRSYRVEAALEPRCNWKCGPVVMAVQLEAMVCTPPQVQVLSAQALEQEMFDTVCTELEHEMGLGLGNGMGDGMGDGMGGGDTSATATLEQQVPALAATAGNAAVMAAGRRQTMGGLHQQQPEDDDDEYEDVPLQLSQPECGQQQQAVLAVKTASVSVASAAGAPRSFRVGEGHVTTAAGAVDDGDDGDDDTRDQQWGGGGGAGEDEPMTSVPLSTAVTRVHVIMSDMLAVSTIVEPDQQHLQQHDKQQQQCYDQQQQRCDHHHHQQQHKVVGNAVEGTDQDKDAGGGRDVDTNNSKQVRGGVR